jgi:predicted dehydrogenase
MSRPIDFAAIRLGVAGLGRAGMFHIESIGLRDDCRIVAAYDDCAAARKRARISNCVGHASWNEFLGNDEIEVVLIAAPPALHAELAIAALAAGKHVLVETPLCLNVVEADAMIAAAARFGRSISVAHLRRWDDDFRTAQSTLASGELGPLQAIKLINWQYNPRRTMKRSKGLANSQEHSNCAESGPASIPGDDIPSDYWRDDAATGGGVLWEFGIHYFDQLLQLTDRPVESVYSCLAPSMPPSRAALSAEDSFLTVISFSGGLTAQVEVSRSAAAPLSTGWMIAGALGGYAGFTQYSPTPDGEVADFSLAPVPSQADEFYEKLVRHLRMGEPNPVSAEEARRSVVLIEAVRESARSGQVVKMRATSSPAHRCST